MLFGCYMAGGTRFRGGGSWGGGGVEFGGVCVCVGGGGGTQVLNSVTSGCVWNPIFFFFF